MTESHTRITIVLSYNIGVLVVLVYMYRCTGILYIYIYIYIYVPVYWYVSWYTGVLVYWFLSRVQIFAHNCSKFGDCDPYTVLTLSFHGVFLQSRWCWHLVLSELAM